MTSFHRLTRLAATLALTALGPLPAQPQSANRSVVQVPQRPAPSTITPVTPGPGAPSPSGLASPTPSPGGLTSRFPAGLPSPSPFPAGMPPVTGRTLTSPAVPVTPPADGTVLMLPAGAGVAGVTGVMGAAGGPAGPQSFPAGPGPYTALQLAQSFLLADANRDGELTRAEARRLTIMPLSFEEIDRNKDGVLSRSEYEDGAR